MDVARFAPQRSRCPCWGEPEPLPQNARIWNLINRITVAYHVVKNNPMAMKRCNGHLLQLIDASRQLTPFCDSSFKKSCFAIRQLVISVTIGQLPPVL